MLVPTTILAQQHAATLRDRFRDFPIRVEMVSRFRAPAEVKKVLADFRAGKVDVLVGTHRVLSRDVVPQELGLVVLDEEQRFGVAQKELLRQLRLEVDVLAMSATPIPRTLHMSLSGLRDISVITTPPRDRHPIKTHVGEFDEELIAAALRREAARGGQSFYLYNRVETIEDVAERVRRWVPELRVGVAHGQMPERALEGVMMKFLRGDFDVLVSTTIIESGLDIPQANTLIVERADTLGLAQLYQIRGRVGRSERRRPRVPLLPRPARAERGGPPPALDPGRLHRARLGLPDRDARPRAARRREPARRRAVRARRRGRVRALLRAPGRGGRRAAGRRRRPSPGRCGSRPRSMPTSRPTTCRSRPSRSTCTGGWRWPATARSCARSRRSWPTGSARCPNRSQTCSRSRSCGSWPARWASCRRRFAAARSRSGPIALGSAEMRELRARFPALRYTVATRELSLRLAVEAPSHTAQGAPGIGIARCYNRRPPRDCGVVRMGRTLRILILAAIAASTAACGGSSSSASNSLQQSAISRSWATCTSPGRTSTTRSSSRCGRCRSGRSRAPAGRRGRRTARTRPEDPQGRHERVHDDHRPAGRRLPRDPGPGREHRQGAARERHAASS